MSTLQVWLLVLGVMVVAGVIAHGVWSARRSAVRQVETEPGEAAMGREPSMDRPADPAQADAAATRIEPTLARRGGPRLDALIDAIAAITVESPVAGETAVTHLPPARRAGTKPLLVEGLNAESGEWELPVPGQRYGEFQAGVQLANRSGALNEIEYSEFVQKVQAFAEPLAALPDFPDMLDAVARARELDAFASQHDAQLALRLVSRGPAWSPGYVQQHAARHGFVTGALPGRLVLPGLDEGAPPVLTLNFDAQAALADDPSQAPLRELTLAFDVPQTGSAAAPFAAWCAAGEALSSELDAALYDDGGQPLHPTSFAAIGQELERLYASLAERDLAAGSAAARRLFS
ncbi:MAG: cell division protein FtsZ [Methylibium sp.]|nr:cell division protein FtsZ [Methylibium sp.]